MATVSNCVGHIIERMSLEEKGLMRLVAIHGKDVTENAKDILCDVSKLRNIGKKESNIKLIDSMNLAFQSGFGLVDWICGRNDSYGDQLDYIIENVLNKKMNIEMPSFHATSDSYNGAIERESFILEKLLEVMWDKIDIETKNILIGGIEKSLIEKGMRLDKVKYATSVLAAGGIIAAFGVLGPIIIGAISRLMLGIMVGEGIIVAGEVFLGGVAGILFGPIGWMVIIFQLPGLILSRELDVYLFLIMFIAMKRAESKNEEINNV